MYVNQAPNQALDLIDQYKQQSVCTTGSICCTILCAPCILSCCICAIICCGIGCGEDLLKSAKKDLKKLKITDETVQGYTPEFKKDKITEQIDKTNAILKRLKKQCNGIVYKNVDTGKVYEDFKQWKTEHTSEQNVSQPAVVPEVNVPIINEMFNVG